MQKLREIPDFAVRSHAAIGIDILAEQRDLARAEIGQAAGLIQNLRNGPRVFAAARVGHDAEGAELVATFLHGEEHAGTGVHVLRRQCVELVFGGKFGFQRLAACARDLRAIISGRR